MALDTNGDGTTDITVFPEEMTLGELITLLKEKIQALDTKEKLKKNLLKKVANLEKKIVYWGQPPFMI